MPSLHTAWAVWVTVAVLMLTTRWWIRTLAVIYPLVTVVVVIATGNHYLLDTVAGAAVAIIALVIVGLISPARQGTKKKSVPTPA